MGAPWKQTLLASYQPQYLKRHLPHGAQCPLRGCHCVNDQPPPHHHFHRCPKVPPTAAALAKLSYNRRRDARIRPKGPGGRARRARRGGARGGGGSGGTRVPGRLPTALAVLAAAPLPHGRPVWLRGVRLQVLGKGVSGDRERAPASPGGGPGEGAERRGEGVWSRAAPGPALRPPFPPSRVEELGRRGARRPGAASGGRAREGAPACRLAHPPLGPAAGSEGHFPISYGRLRAPTLALWPRASRVVVQPGALGGWLSWTLPFFFGKDSCRLLFEGQEQLERRRPWLC